MSRIPQDELIRLLSVGNASQLREAAADVALDAVECGDRALICFEAGDFYTARQWVEIARQWVTVCENLRAQAEIRQRQASLWVVTDADHPDVQRVFMDRWMRGNEPSRDAS